MNTTTLQQIEAQAEKLAATAKALAREHKEAGLGESSPEWGSASSVVPHEVDRLRSKMLASVNRLQAMLAAPSDFIQHISHQTQILACLRWLSEFQVLACIPPSGEAIGTNDLADLVSVPEVQLRRVVRLLATAGFLVLEEQHQQGGLLGGSTRQAQVAHSRLSASFVTEFSNLDAVMFLSGTAVQAALHMPEATQRQLSGFSLTSTPLGLDFGTACKQQPRLRRQWNAYLGCLKDPNRIIADLLDRLDWASLGRALVVEIDASSTELAQSLTEKHPGLHWIVQMCGSAAAKYERDTGMLVGASAGGCGLAGASGSRPTSWEKLTSQGSSGIEVQLRTPHTPQVVKDAAVYLVRGPSDLLDYQGLATWVQAELQSHLDVLRASPDSLLLLAVEQLRPDPGSVDPAVEAVAAARAMNFAQLAGDEAPEMDLAKLEQLVGSVRDNNTKDGGGGGLVVLNKLHNRHSSTIALGIKYVSRPNPPEPPLAMIEPSLGNLGWGGILSP